MCSQNFWLVHPTELATFPQFPGPETTSLSICYSFSDFSFACCMNQPFAFLHHGSANDGLLQCMDPATDKEGALGGPLFLSNS